jgi:hypothetical protein
VSWYVRHHSHRHLGNLFIHDFFDVLLAKSWSQAEQYPRVSARNRLHKPGFWHMARQAANAAPLIELVPDFVPTDVRRIPAVGTAVNSACLHMQACESATGAVHVPWNFDAAA